MSMRAADPVIERQFLTMAAGPQPLTLDCAALGCGLPPEDMPLDRLRLLLLKRRTSWLTKDVVWQELVRWAYAEPEPWITVAAAMMPGLKHAGGHLILAPGLDRGGLDRQHRVPGLQQGVNEPPSRRSIATGMRLTSPSLPSRVASRANAAAVWSMVKAVSFWPRVPWFSQCGLDCPRIRQ